MSEQDPEQVALADYQRLIERAARALAQALESADGEELDPVLDPEPCP